MGSGWPKPQGKPDRCQTAPPDPVGPKKDGTLPHLTAAHNAPAGGPARQGGGGPCLAVPCPPQPDTADGLHGLHSDGSLAATPPRERITGQADCMAPSLPLRGSAKTARAGWTICAGAIALPGTPAPQPVAGAGESPAPQDDLRHPFGLTRAGPHAADERVTPQRTSAAQEHGARCGIRPWPRSGCRTLLCAVTLPWHAAALYPARSGRYIPCEPCRRMPCPKTTSTAI